MTMSLTHRVLLLVTTVVFVCLIFLAWMSFSVTQHVVENAVSDQQVLLARKTLDQMNQFLYERHYDMGLLSNSSQAIQILSGSADKAVLSTWIGNIAVAAGPWQEIRLVNEQGVIIYSTDVKEIGTSIEIDEVDLDLFTKAKNGLTVYSDQVKMGASGKSTMVFASPVWKREGDTVERIGVVVGHISWPILEEFLPRNEVHAILVNKYGVVLAENHIYDQTTLVGKNLSDERTIQRILDSKQPESQQSLSLSGNFPSLTTHVHEAGYLDYHGNGWALIFEVPEAVAFADANKEAWRMLAVIIPVLSFGALAVVLLMIFYVVRPIILLNKASVKLTQGDFSQRVKVHVHDEIGQLAITFNNMAQQLHTYTRDLEEKITNRTHELEHRLKFEQLIASVSARLMEADNLKEAITSSLQELGERKHATGAEVYILKPNSTVMTSITEWVLDEKYRTPITDLTLDLSIFPSWEEQLRLNGSLLIHDVSKMPQELQQESTYLTKLGIKSVMALPFAIGVIVSGVIVVSNHEEPQDWNDQDISLLKTVAEMIGSALARDQSETLLRDQKQLLTKVISTIPEHVFWKDAHSTYLGCNTQFAKVAGLNNPEEIVGKTDYDMPWTKEEADHYRAIDHEVMVSGKPTLNLQETQRQADDNDVIVSTSKVPLVSDSGETFGILGMYSDITERVNFEKRLAESEAMFRMTANAIKEGITLSDEQGTFYVYNHEMEQLTGYSMAEANAAGNFHALLHPDNLLEEKDKVGEIANYKVGERYATDTKIRTKRGEVRYLKVSAVVINHQKKRMFLSAFSDITELKDAEAALLHEKATVERKITLRTAELEKARVDLDTSLRLSQAETDKIKAILQSIGDGVLVLDQDRKILVVNHATVELSGFTQEELINTVYNDHLQFVFEKNGVENHGFIDKVYEEGMLTYMANHTTLLRKDGTSLSVADSAAPLKDDSGKVIGCVMVFRDVSKEREVERMKDEFISIASHQLRTPLTALRWMTEIMEQPTTGPLTKDQAELIHDMRGSTKRLISLVNDLLNITRIESGRMTVDPLPTDLPELVRSVLTDTQVKFAIKKQQGILEADPSLPMISIDPKLIRQVYLNLIANASNYSAESSKVFIKVFVKDGFMVSEIIDTGLGIPASQQPHIFQKFFRADNATMANSDGTGLGLYLAKMAVEASGGQISFESVEGKGTTFRFTLPLAGSIPQKGEISLT